MFRTGQSYPSDYTSHDSRPENGRRSVIRMEQSNPSDNTSHDSRPENGRRRSVLYRQLTACCSYMTNTEHEAYVWTRYKRICVIAAQAL